jgi:hypothetical protein
MKTLPVCFSIMMTVLAVSGCSSGGGSHNNSGDYIGPVYPASGMYYGSYDYYDYYDYYPEYIVTPRPPVDAPEGPDNRPGLHPEHPIANPPGDRLENRPGNRPSTLPADRASSRSRSPSMSQQRARTASRAAPSIPSRSRPMGGGRRGGGGRRR